MPQEDPLRQLLHLVAFSEPTHARSFLASLSPEDLEALAIRLADASTPSENQWFALCDTLSALPDAPRLPTRIPALEQALDAWPDTLKWAPDAWYRRVRAAEREPRWPLVRALDLSGERLDDTKLERLLHTLDTSRLRILLLVDNALGEALSNLLTPTVLPQLHTLELSHNPLGPDGLTQLASAPLLAQLQHLALSHVNADDPAFATFLKRAPLHRLHTLELAHNPIAHQAAHTLALCPWIHTLENLGLAHTTLGDKGLAALARAERFSRLHTLVLSHAHIHGPGLAEWAQHARTPALTQLLLDGNTLEPADFNTFIQNEDCASALELLDLSGSQIGPTGTEGLAQSTALTHLRTLILRENAIDTRGARALAAAPLPALTHLDLYKNGLGTEGIQAFAHNLELPALIHLGLGMNAMHDEGLSALAASQALTRLQRLELAWNEISKRGLSALLRSPLEALQALDLSVNLLDDDAIRILTRAELSLHELHLGWNRLEAPAAQHLAAAPSLTSLKHLHLSHNALGNEGASHLAAAPHLQLTTLALDRNAIEDEGARVLAQSPLLKTLETLNLSNNLISDEGALALANTPHLVHLRELHLEDNPIGDEGAEALRRSPYLRARIHLGRTRP